MGFDTCEQARVALLADLQVATTFKDTQRPFLVAADEGQKKVGKELSRAFASSRPPSPVTTRRVSTTLRPAPSPTIKRFATLPEVNSFRTMCALTGASPTAMFAFRSAFFSASSKIGRAHV